MKKKSNLKKHPRELVVGEN